MEEKEVRLFLLYYIDGTGHGEYIRIKGVGEIQKVILVPFVDIDCIRAGVRYEDGIWILSLLGPYFRNDPVSLCPSCNRPGD